MELIGSLFTTTGRVSNLLSVFEKMFQSWCFLQCCFQPRACQKSKYNGFAQSFVPFVSFEPDYSQVGVSFGETRELAFLHAKSGTKVRA